MRIVICEDSVLLREGLTRLLAEGGHHVTAAVADAEALIAAVTDGPPDLAIIDVRLPPTQTNEGIRAALQIRENQPDLPILVLSQYVEERYAVDLILGGARGLGYLLKERVSDLDEFLEAIERVAGGGSAIDPEVVTQLLGRRRVGNPLDTLTPREVDVLKGMAEGRTNAAIAAGLVLTQGAVEKHASNIFTKLGLDSVTSENRRVTAVLTYLRNAGT